MLTLSYHLQSMKWILPAGFLLGTAPSYYALWGSWRVLSAVLPGRIFEAGDEFLYSLYQKAILFFFENCSGTEVILYGDIDEVLAKKENVIFMCNHQCTVDWLIADVLAVRQGSLGNIRYILKDGLKYLPLYGYYFRQHSCVYVKRGGTFDEKKADKQLSLFIKNKTPFWMVVFPEGTRYNPELSQVIANSRDFSKSRGFPVFEQVLCPRFKALQLCTEKLRPTTDAIYDVCVAYNSRMASSTGKRPPGPSLADFLQGQCSAVHIHVTRISIDKVPIDEHLFQEWLLKQFEHKDRLLRKFYSSEVSSSSRGTFGEDSCQHHPLSIVSTLPAFLFFTGLNAPFLFTETGRGIYWRLAILGTLFSWAWVTVRN